MLWASLRGARAAVALGSVLAAIAPAWTVATAARADSSGSLTVVGTSDVSDSGLMSNVIQPAFQAAYPQYTFKYIGTATGKAIADAETGTFGPSALIVHAASLENRLVAGGFSAERYGRAIFRNDFVLAGPKRDPATVRRNAAHNIARAFADVAAAGIARHATFVSRGGTPGTTVAEHQIWTLVQRSHLAPTGLLLCEVDAANGGGETPIAAGNGVTANGQPCPGGGALPTGPSLPSWYGATGLTQGPNVQLANACTSFASGPNSCYVFTDRGTFDYLRSGTDPAGSISNMKEVTSDNADSAPGGSRELINYFHAYAINRSKPGESVNAVAATDFLNLITSPSLQAAIGRYLAHTGDPGGAPFVPDASPTIRGRLPRRAIEGQQLTIRGRVMNAELGYRAPTGLAVSLDRIVAGFPIPIASTRTSRGGTYRLTFTLRATGTYELVTPQASQIENSSLRPPFGDILSPAATDPWRIAVAGSRSRTR